MWECVSRKIFKCHISPIGNSIYNFRSPFSVFRSQFSVHHYASSGFSTAILMYRAESIVNTNAWIYATRHSSRLINTEKSTDTTDTAPPTDRLKVLERMKIITTKPRITICPAVMLANRRIISTIGFVNTPTSSTTGIKGNTFNHAGTPGVLKISFQ